MTPPLVIPPYLKEAPLTGLIGMGGGATSHRVYTSSSADAYQIKKSVRFDEAGTTYFNKTFSLGNRRVWTWSGWLKRTNVNNSVNGEIDVFWEARTSASSLSMFQFTASDELEVYNYPGSYTTQKVTKRKFRDPSAWYHIVISYNGEAGGTKIFVNGVQETDFDTNNEASADEEWMFNTANAHQLGRRADGTTPHFNGYLTEVYWIDGLALHPAAFAKYSSSGSWEPKAFALSTPNGGTTWSNETWKYVSDNSTVSWTGALSRAFNTEPTWGTNAYASTGNDLYWEPSVDLPLTTSLEIWGDYNYVGGKPIEVHTDSGTAYTTLYSSGWSSNQKVRLNIPLDSTKLTKLVIPAQGTSINFNAIVVDGVNLVDGATDPTTRNNPNNGITWSDLVTGTAYTNQGGDKAFDGLSSTMSQASNPGNASLTFKPPRDITGRVEILIAAGLHGGAVTGEFDLKIGNVSKFDNSIWPSNTTGWVDLGTQTIDTTYGLVWGNASGGNWHGIKMIKIDGHVMLDAASDNSYHLKFDDITSTTTLGYDSLSTRTIRKPGSTTDLNEDSSKASLVLAIPGDTIEDVHHTIKGSGSAKSLTNTNCTTSTTTSHFYGTSTHLNGTDAKLTTTTDASDFDISGGTFAFECWFMSGESTSTSKTIVSTKETGGGTGALELGINQNKLFCYSGSNQIMTTTESTATVSALTTDQWYHLAVTRDGTTWRWFVDGVLAHSNATSVSGSSDGCYFGYASTAGGSPSTRWLNGNYQDIRFYKGAAKYTTAFAPPAPNNFTSNNISLSTASDGVDLDSLTDTPTNYGTDTGLGGEIQGNFCTWNPLNKASNINTREGNLRANMDGDGHQMITGTLGMVSGKYYWELIPVWGAHAGPIVGVAGDQHVIADQAGGSPTIGYRANGSVFNNGSTPVTGQTTFSSGDVIGIVFNVDTKTITFYANNSELYEYTFTNDSTAWIPFWKDYPTNANCKANFGQRAFKYNRGVTESCKTICTQNIADTFGNNSDTNNPSKYFDIKLYTGTASDLAIGGVPFQPDIIWLKNRSDNSTSHCWQDVIGGANLGLHPDTSVGHQSGWDGVITTDWDSDGFSASPHSYSNAAGKEYVAWMWDAGTSAATPSSSGSVTPSDQWVNNTSRFSITKWAGDDTNPYTVGHGLSTKPEFMLIKRIDGAGGWFVYHTSIGATKYLQLDVNSAAGTDAGFMNDTEPTSSIFTLGNWNGYDSGSTLMAYSWTSVAGYSAFGAYDGNGSSSGPFVYTGFAPRWVVIGPNSHSGNWGLWDIERNTYNVMYSRFGPHTSDGDLPSGIDVNVYLDMYSNGFRPRNSDTDSNGSGRSYVYCAFADHPFKTSRAR